MGNLHGVGCAESLNRLMVQAEKSPRQRAERVGYSRTCFHNAASTDVNLVNERSSASISR